MGNPSRHLYPTILRIIDDDELYAAATLAGLAVSKGVIKAHNEHGCRKAKARMRIALARLKATHIRQVSDGELAGNGPPIPAWYGWRWKQAIVEDLRATGVQRETRRVPHE